ncbi:MAG: ATP-dependent DNA helicase RecG [Gammaproteobacteria bacterium]|nr:ATP-dependent DNA helicase RecG [Gammaproteobacteria bacterium]
MNRDEAAIDRDIFPPVTSLKGVGPKIEGHLQRLRIHTVQDLLFHLPIRYQDRTRVRPIGALQPGDECVLLGTVDHSEMVYRKRRMLLVSISDGTGRILLRFFHFNKTQQENLAPGVNIRCFGEVRRGVSTLEMVHPEYEIQRTSGAVKVEDHLTPIYPTTEGLHQLVLRRMTSQALRWFEREEAPDIDLLPDVPEIDGCKPSVLEALRFVHRPPPEADTQALAAGTHVMQRRLAFEELLAQRLSLFRLRLRMQKQPAVPISPAGRLYARLIEALEFTPTSAQQRVIETVFADLRKSYPMLRLVQGDVGSGKTLVAIAACLHVIEAGYQAVVMAPTEILAEQHLQNFSNWLAPLGVQLAWLSGRMTAARNSEMKERISSGTAQAIIGTHALFQEGVTFKNLALVVVDEQHRFGVHQRMALREKGVHGAGSPHQLIMTATPIPRTLAMTAYADLDYSVIDEMPPGRKPVSTIAVSQERRDEVIERVAHACQRGQQAYWVCTLVEESEAMQCQAAENVYQELDRLLQGVRVGLVHGRMKSREKNAVMQDFASSRIDLLVATTVIEVGVDVANASLMIIENAERLGLAQLHQLRGRVGRGAQESSCVMLYSPPLTDNANLRIDTMRATNNGFKIAQVDLEIRGPGEVLGTRQTGMLQLRIADILRDQDLIPQVQESAKKLFAEHPHLVDALVHRWLGKSIEFGQV